jgi:hypothetical protein
MNDLAELHYKSDNLTMMKVKGAINDAFKKYHRLGYPSYKTADDLFLQ